VDPLAYLPDPDTLVAGVKAAHRRLAATVAEVTDDTARAPSRLPGWTVGHVLTHLARNADSHSRMLEGALAGERLHQYPGGREQRRADIDAGSNRPASELRADVEASAQRLEAVWEAMTETAWAGGGLFEDGGPWPAPLIVFLRWREVEVHHADLGLGYEPDDWPDGYVAVELARQLAALPARLDGAQHRRLTAWLLGRVAEPALGRSTPRRPRSGPELATGRAGRNPRCDGGVPG
jgi:maleylpyruvate isomerase